jgi:hypothetical protein
MVSFDNQEFSILRKFIQNGFFEFIVIFRMTAPDEFIVQDVYNFHEIIPSVLKNFLRTTQFFESVWSTVIEHASIVIDR